MSPKCIKNVDVTVNVIAYRIRSENMEAIRKIYIYDVKIYTHTEIDARKAEEVYLMCIIKFS